MNHRIVSPEIVAAMGVALPRVLDAVRELPPMAAMRVLEYACTLAEDAVPDRQERTMVQYVEAMQNALREMNEGAKPALE